jgi:hypothetical protein
VFDLLLLISPSQVLEGSFDKRAVGTLLTAPGDFFMFSSGIRDKFVNTFCLQYFIIIFFLLLRLYLTEQSLLWNYGKQGFLRMPWLSRKVLHLL